MSILAAEGELEKINRATRLESYAAYREFVRSFKGN